jgi:hypothetical protein
LQFFALFVLFYGRLSQAAPIDMDTAVMMAAEMSGSVNELSREVTTYHWQPRSKVGVPLTGPVDPQDPYGMGYFKGVTGSFWGNGTSYGLMMGNGIYAATDPFVSQGYGGGGDGWTLFAINMKTGTRLFDARDYKSFSGQLQARLQALGCPAWRSASQIFENNVVPSDVCAYTFRQAVRILGIQGVVYSWGGASLTACSIRNGWWTPAIVLIDPELAPGVRILVKEIPPHDPAEIHDLRIRITQFFKLVQYNPYGMSVELWPSLSSAESPADMVEWIQSHTYFCDSVNWEDLMPSQLIFSSAELAEKREEVEEKTGIVKTETGRSLLPWRFANVLALQYYTPSELQKGSTAELVAAPAFKSWLQAHDALMGSAREREPLSLSSISQWVQTVGGSASAIAWVPERAQAFSDLLSELDAALLHPRQASARDKPLLRDTDALIRAYHDRVMQLAPLTSLNDRMARALADYMAEIRGWPPILIRTSLGEISSLGALKAVVIADKCLDRYAHGTVDAGSDCERVP